MGRTSLSWFLGCQPQPGAAGPHRRQHSRHTIVPMVPIIDDGTGGALGECIHRHSVKCQELTPTPPMRDDSGRRRGKKVRC
jgi:hypothetical protein